MIENLNFEVFIPNMVLNNRGSIFENSVWVSLKTTVFFTYILPLAKNMDSLFLKYISALIINP